jgi:hypothetical protein
MSTAQRILLVITLIFCVGSCTDERRPDLVSPATTSVDATQSSINPQTPQNIPAATVQLLKGTKGLRRTLGPAGELPTLTPATLTATLRPGESVPEHKVLNLPAQYLPPMADVLISFDLTGSMGGELNNVKLNSQNIMTQVQGYIPDSRFGVISHMDYPSSFSGCGYSGTYGTSGDYPYALNQSITSVNSDVTIAINALNLGNGYDTPEDYTRAFYETYSDPLVGWRSGAQKIVLAFLDSWPHDCAYNAILGGSTSTGPDPGRDGIAGTADDLAILDVLDAMKANNEILIVVYSGIPGSYFNLWDAYCMRTGGHAFQINADGTIPGGIDIAAFIASLIQSAVTQFSTVSLQTCDPAYAPWLTSVVPLSYANIDLGSAIDLGFDVTITVPAGTPAGTYAFDLCAIGDGVELARQQITITVVVAIDVGFDFHPTSCPNPLRIGSAGVTPTAINGLPGFDVSMIDPATVRLEGVPPLRWAVEDVCAPFHPFIGKTECTECNTLGPDGYPDLTLKFDTQALVQALGFVENKQCRVVHMIGNLKPEFGGIPIRGEDVVRIITK